MNTFLMNIQNQSGQGDNVLIPRCDPLHPAGGLPALLGRGPAEAVRPDQGRGLRLPQPGVGQRDPGGERGIHRVSLYSLTLNTDHSRGQINLPVSFYFKPDHVCGQSQKS